MENDPEDYIARIRGRDLPENAVVLNAKDGVVTEGRAGPTISYGNMTARVADRVLRGDPTDVTSELEALGDLIYYKLEDSGNKKGCNTKQEEFPDAVLTCVGDYRSPEVLKSAKKKIKDRNCNKKRNKKRRMSLQDDRNANSEGIGLNGQEVSDPTTWEQGQNVADLDWLRGLDFSEGIDLSPLLDSLDNPSPQPQEQDSDQNEEQNEENEGAEDASPGPVVDENARYGNKKVGKIETYVGCRLDQVVFSEQSTNRILFSGPVAYGGELDLTQSLHQTEYLVRVEWYEKGEPFGTRIEFVTEQRGVRRTYTSSGFRRDPHNGPCRSLGQRDDVGRRHSFECTGNQHIIGLVTEEKIDRETGLMHHFITNIVVSEWRQDDNPTP